MIQVSNLITDLALLFEVLFLFTCGQRYMKLSILRNRRNFAIERWTYLAIGILSVVDGFYNREPQPTEILFKLAVVFLLFRKCLTANKHYHNLKSAGNANQN